MNRKLWLSVILKHFACINNARFGRTAVAKEYKLVILTSSGFQQNTITWPQPHIVFCLQPLEVSYSYYL